MDITMLDHETTAEANEAVLGMQDGNMGSTLPLSTKQLSSHYARLEQQEREQRRKSQQHRKRGSPRQLLHGCGRARSSSREQRQSVQSIEDSGEPSVNGETFVRASTDPESPR